MVDFKKMLREQQEEEAARHRIAPASRARSRALELRDPREDPDRVNVIKPAADPARMYYRPSTKKEPVATGCSRLVIRYQFGQDRWLAVLEDVEAGRRCTLCRYKKLSSVIADVIPMAYTMGREMVEIEMTFPEMEGPHYVSDLTRSVEEYAHTLADLSEMFDASAASTYANDLTQDTMSTVILMIRSGRIDALFPRNRDLDLAQLGDMIRDAARSMRQDQRR